MRLAKRLHDISLKNASLPWPLLTCAAGALVALGVAGGGVAPGALVGPPQGGQGVFGRPCGYSQPPLGHTLRPATEGRGVRRVSQTARGGSRLTVE